MTTVRPFLWFDDDADEALDFYHQVFADSEVVTVERADAGSSQGRLLTGTLRILNLEIMLFNGGPDHPFNESISLFVACEDQGEVDHYWDALVKGGRAIACGWLTDRFGVTWQIVPQVLMELLSQPDPERAARVHAAMMSMVKLDAAALVAASESEPQM